MTDLAIQEYGAGKPIILIHGFPMNKKVFATFAPKLASGFKVITIDLPGFGMSPMPVSPITISSVASQLLGWIAGHAIDQSVIVGHSLGGYVALAMAEQAPERFAGLALFHSTALADANEKKQSRDKVVEFVEKNGAPAFTSNFIPPLFSDKEHPAVDLVMGISAESTAAAVIGYTRAMRDRKDQKETLAKFKKPILFLVGKEDPGIPVESIRQQALVCQQPDVQILDSVAHMGMFEAEETALDRISSFAEKAFEKNG